MQSFKLIIVFALVFYSCNLKNEEKNKLKTISIDSTRIVNSNQQLDYYILGDSIATKVIAGRPRLSYKFNVDTSGYFLKSIIVYSDSIKVQEIICNKHIERKEFRLVDWNFDGYKDISVLSNCGSGGCAYLIWNYSPPNGKYYYNKKLSAYTGLEIDTASKYIVFHYRAGYPEENWDTFEYQENKLVFVKGVYQERWNDTLGNSWIKRTYSRIVNGMHVTTADSSIIE